MTNLSADFRERKMELYMRILLNYRRKEGFYTKRQIKFVFEIKKKVI